MHLDAIFAGLNAEQRHAVEAVRGPVCILAGAGSGKTTTITRRIANQVATGAFVGVEILAVTFTEKAAGEMRARLDALGVSGVRASTFHSAALGQLHAYGSPPTGGVLPSKAMLLMQVARSLPRPFRFRPVGDLATEIEWAKNRRLSPETYPHALGDHRPPLPPDVMTRVFRDYERRKARLGRLDFEDVLELAIRMLEADDHAREAFRSRFRTFTVDEYQDANLLQQTLLDLWLDARDELCVVGDDHQAIYGFTGATPEYLLAMPSRFRNAIVVRLEENYRSTPQVIALANRLVPRLGGTEKRLRAVRPTGPDPLVLAFEGPAETRFLVERVAALHRDEGVAYDEIAVLYRTNARSPAYEQAFSRAAIPFQVREGGFLTRQAARRLRTTLKRKRSTAVAEAVYAAARSDGLLPTVTKRLGEQELVRQGDLARLVELAREFDDGERTIADFLCHLEERFGPQADVRGVQLLTYHRAKGLEFEAVFLPRLEERELPIRYAKTADEIAEERRLLYVGITRAKRFLFLTRSTAAPGSPFLAEMEIATGLARATGEHVRLEVVETPTHAALRRWRRERAHADGVPAFIVLHDRTLAAIAIRKPASRAELAGIPGIGPSKLERYGEDLLRALAAA
ncbi:MAG: ATP-dependent DNA helicase UvrD2 [Actinomycetota bacterium]|nr:ATP-dependent DNA helicase UvrD2 [Actinomycetota bacterium]